MTVTPSTLAALSREEIARSLRENWGADTSGLWLLLVMGLALAAVLAAVHFRWRREPSDKRDEGSRPFDELAALLELPASDQKLLRRISAFGRLPSPLTLLLSPRTLRVHAMAFAAHWPPKKRSRFLRRIATLRQIIRGN